MSDIDARIKAAEERLEAASIARAAASADLDALYILRSKEIHGIDVGMRVRRRDSEFVVTAIHPDNWRSKPWLTGLKIKKDGTPGEAKRTIYGDWEIVALKTAEGK